MGAPGGARGKPTVVRIGAGTITDTGIKGTRMPIGNFLDSIPVVLFVVTHILMIGIGIWTIIRTRGRSVAISNALWLYVASQPGFLAFFAGLITLKLAVVTEQTLIIAMVIWLTLGSQRDATRV